MSIFYTGNQIFMTIGEVMEVYKESAIKKFNFLVSDYSFSLTEVATKSDTCYLLYTKNNITSCLRAEPLDKRFYYYLNDGDKVVIFHDFFNRFDETINWPELMPLDGDYEKAIDKNILLLKKYGQAFLMGGEKL